MARRLGVSREDVVAAAVRVCDRDGLDGLTVAGVAGEVGCRPPSVYHHVDGLDGLVRAVTFVAAEQLMTALEAAGRDGDPSDVLREMIAVAHAWGVGHPARFDALRRPVDPDADPELAAARSQVLLPLQDALIALGVPVHHRASLLAALVAAVRGCIATDLDVGSDDDPTVADARTTGRDLLVQLLLDHVATVSDNHGNPPGDPGRTDGAPLRRDDPTRAST